MNTSAPDLIPPIFILLSLILFIVFCIYMAVKTIRLRKKTHDQLQVNAMEKMRTAERTREVNAATPTTKGDIARDHCKPNNDLITDEDVSYLIAKGLEDALQSQTEHLKGFRDIFNDHNFSKDERIFFTALSGSLTAKKLDPKRLQLRRLSDGTFNVDYVPICYVGKIRLSGKNTYMQYTIGMTKTEHLYNPTIEECISTIPRWIRYINYCKRS